MNFISRFKAASRILFTGAPSGIYASAQAFGGTPGRRGPLWETSAIAACVRFGGDTFNEAPLKVFSRADEDELPIAGHNLTKLWRRPNAFYSGRSMVSALVLSGMVSGDGYLLKARNGGGAVAELWYVPHFAICPKFPQNGTEFISAYEYTVGAQKVLIAPENVIHWRPYGLDPSSYRQGWTPIKAVLQEVLTDSEAALAAHALMRNRGVAGAVIRPKGEEGSIEAEDADEIRVKYSSIQAEGRGGVLVLSGAADVDFPDGIEAESFEKIRNISAERTCAAIGFDPMVVSLPSQTKTYSNYAEAREAAYEGWVIPRQDELADTLSTQLLPDFADPEQFGVGFDRRKVRVLQGDLDNLWKRVSGAYQVGLIGRKQGQSLIGVGAPEKDDVYATDMAGTPKDQEAKRLMGRIGEESRRRRELFDDLTEEDDAPPDD